MAVMARDAWTDERLDDLNKKVDDGFKETRAEMRAEFRAVRTEMKEEIRGVRSEMTEIRTELGALNRTIHQFLFAVVGTIFLGFMGTIAALITIVPG
jgi:predicted  nucleic acid-binding Zn-ribbon protein